MARIVLVVPSATYRAQDFVRAADALGAEVVVASDRRPALASVMGSRSILVDLDQPELAAQAIIASARRSGVEAVIGVDDQGVLIAALASHGLGLRHNPPEAVAATRDKRAMRAALERAQVPQPRWRALAGGGDVAKVVREIGWPCVIKPTTLAASRGVIRADDLDSACAAAARARGVALEASGSDDLLIEEYIGGIEVAVEGLLRSGDLEVLAIFDKPDPLQGPYFEETIYVTPSRLPRGERARIEARTSDAARALGLTEGPVHAELRIDSDDARVIEIAARSIGGLCSRALRFGMGTSLEELILRHALGLEISMSEREAKASGVMMIPIPRGGRLRDAGGQDEARAIPGIDGLQITIPIGRSVVPLPEGDRYLGFVFASATTPEQVEGALRRAHALLTIDIGDP